MKKLIIQLSFCFVLLIVLSGCKPAAENSKEANITFWAMGVEGETVSKLVPEFEKQNPGIKVRVLQIAWVAAHEKMITAYASETLPDCFQLGNTWIPEFQALNAIEPLNNFVKQSSVVHPENYFAGIWDTNVMDSVFYGIPWYVDTRVLFYRKDLLAKAGYDHPPYTWAELYDASKKIKEQAKPKSVFSFFIPTNEWAPFIIFGMQNGAELLKDNNCYGDFANKKFKDAFDYLARYFYESLAVVDMQQVMNVYQAFGDGFFSFYITGPWNVTEFQKRLPADKQNAWMTAPLPSPDGNYPGYSLAGGASLVVNALSKNKVAAWKFIEYLSKPETQLTFYKLVSSLPAVTAVWKDPVFTRNIYMKAFYDQLQKTKATPKVPEWEQIVTQKIQTSADFVSRRLLTTEQAVKSLDADVNKILEKRRWVIKQ
ncbi:MAG: sugar ABC transporter substrate-binding protein [Ignavibacteriales bacterium]|nr:sugar ABC transporter substrate-binding protein [Ignavibacteriales bacterium]